MSTMKFPHFAIFFVLLIGLNFGARAEEPSLSPPLQELLDLFGIRAEETEALWMQKGKERWEFDRRFEYMRPLAWPLFEKMGLVFEAAPQEKKFRYALVLGALLPAVETRIGYLADQWAKGVRFDQIVFLTGDRPLLEKEKMVCGEEWEGGMIEWAYRQSALPKGIPTLFINAPMKKTKEGTWVRPGTADTVSEWLKSNPEPGNCLAVSNQPYVGYQGTVLQTFLPGTFELETVGPPIKGDPSVALLLDTIAKELLARQAKR